MVTSSFFGRVVMSRYLVEMANIPYTESTRPSILDVITELFASDKFHARPLISELPQVSAVDSRAATNPFLRLKSCLGVAPKISS